jgi:hypothetical protein
VQVLSPLRTKLPGNSLFADLRGELDNLFDGDNGVNGFSFTVILRHIDKKQKAAGFDPLKGESLLDQSLSANNIVFATTDRFVRTIKKKILGRFLDDQAGLVKDNIGIFYFKHTELIVDQDIIIEIPVDDKGNPTSPVKHLKKFQVQDVERVHGNAGRIEYLNVYAERME